MESNSYEVGKGGQIVGLIFNDETARDFIKHLEMDIKECPKGKDGRFFMTFLAKKETEEDQKINWLERLREHSKKQPRENIFESAQDISLYANEMLEQILESSEYSTWIVDSILQEMKSLYEITKALRAMELDKLFEVKLRRQLKGVPKNPHETET